MTERDNAAAEDGLGDDEKSGLAGELRALAIAVLDRVEPALLRIHTDRIHTDQPTTAKASCAGCPVCAVLAILRGERPESAIAMVEQLNGMLKVLRAALEEGDPASAGRSASEARRAPTSEADPTPQRRRVQRIPVERVAPC